MALIPPIILTLNLDDRSFKFFNELRLQHFPRAINFLDAHLTLFHHLPNNEETFGKIKRVASTFKPMPYVVSDVISIGRGVAYRIECTTLPFLHQKLQEEFANELTPQDQQKIRAHVTIQNKVSPVDAKQLLEQQKRSFISFDGLSDGVTVWEYLNGPWRRVTTYPFG